MANNYDDYGYEDDKYSRRRGLLRNIIIIVLVFIAILLLLWLLKGCSNKNGKKVTPTPQVYDYTSDLLKAGKSYFDSHYEEKPQSVGECSIVELQSLISNNLVDSTKYTKCNLNTTYVKTCILENGVRHYSPWIKCSDKDSENEYDTLKEGTVGEVIAESTYTQFRFLPQEMRKGKETLGKVEEMWKDEIPYESYKTLKTTKYYRYRDKLFTWNLTKKNYYTRGGDKTNSKDVSEYYQTSPKNGYTKSDSKTTEAYKWYTTTAKKEYYMVEGAKMPSITPVGEYNIRDPKGIDVTRYRSRTKIGEYSPYKYYVCSTSASSPILKYTTNECSKEKEYKVLRDTKWSCTSPESETASIIDGLVSKNSKCNKYSAWSEVTKTKCDTSKEDICQFVTLTFYYWYKELAGVKSYYPSGSSNVKDEKVYYTEAPIKGAVKDSSTKATAYKWYNEVKTTSTAFTAVAPSGYSSATRTSQYKWSDWSSWSKTNPAIKDGRERSIEKKTKIKLQQITGSTEDGWDTLSSEYLSEEEMLNLYRNKKYTVNTLEDIVNNGQIRYQVKMYIRNKKESK